MAQLRRKNNCCNQTIIDSCVQPAVKECNSSCKLYTGEVTENDFLDGVTLKSSNVKIITANSTFFKFIDIKDRDKCGNILNLPIKNGSHLDLSDEFKEQLEILIREGGLEKYLKSILIKPSFKEWFSDYFLTIIKEGYLDICKAIEKCGVNTPVNQEPTLRDITKKGSSGNITKEEILDNYLDNEGDKVTHIKFLNPNPGSSFDINIRNNSEYDVWIPIEDFNSLDWQVDPSSTATIKVQIKNNKNQETNLATITLINAQVPDSEQRCICLTSAQTISNINLNYNRNYTNHQIGTLTYKNNCSTPYTINRTLISNIPGLTFSVKGIVGGNQASVTLPVTVTGRVNNTTVGASQAISGNTAQSCGTGTAFNVTLSGTISNNDTYASCVTINAFSTTENITKGVAVNKQSAQSVTFTNNCESTITVPEIVFINENGLKVSIPSFSLPKGSQTKTISIVGTYTGTKSTITGTQNINGTNATINVTVTDPDTAPVTKDVTINLANRTNTEITRNNLNWEDAQNDALQAVRFKGDVSKLFTNPERTTPYVANTELAPTFTLYFKAPDQDTTSTYTVKYNVKANNKWSV